MGQINIAENKDTSTNLTMQISQTFVKMQQIPTYKWALVILGMPVYLVVFFIFLFQKKNDAYKEVQQVVKQRLLDSGYLDELREEFKGQLTRKYDFFHQSVSEVKLSAEVEKLVADRFEQVLSEQTMLELHARGEENITFSNTFAKLLSYPAFFFITLIPGILMYTLMHIFSRPYLKYIFDRLIMSLFVIVGVAVLVFTILYLSPFDPAANILGETATDEQIENFNQLYGLDLPYHVQLWNAVKGILTFDLGSSFMGNEEVASSIANKFPITMILTFLALGMAILIAIPVGIISATKQNSFLDYTFMFIALIGLSIPNFWQGLVFILGFSIKLQWLPATFNPDSWLSIIMPTIVLGTALTASVARMTRSSMLEVINEDYIITAKAKGLNQSTILWKHAITNAIIPIITVIGLLFGGMLGGSAVTEKVFNISGIGSYIVEKQFIPDIPGILGGVVYIAVVISLVNLLIDISYAFFDPRIRSKMKNY